MLLYNFPNPYNNMVCGPVWNRTPWGWPPGTPLRMICRSPDVPLRMSSMLWWTHPRWPPGQALWRGPPGTSLGTSSRSPSGIAEEDLCGDDPHAIRWTSLGMSSRGHQVCLMVRTCTVRAASWLCRSTNGHRVLIGRDLCIWRSLGT